MVVAESTSGAVQGVASGQVNVTVPVEPGLVESCAGGLAEVPSEFMNVQV